MAEFTEEVLQQVYKAAHRQQYKTTRSCFQFKMPRSWRRGVLKSPALLGRTYKRNGGWRVTAFIEKRTPAVLAFAHHIVKHACKRE